LKALSPDTRTLWVRFVAISADAELAAPMLPVFSKGSVLLVDRHYCSLDAYRKHLIGVLLDPPVSHFRVTGTTFIPRFDVTDFSDYFTAINQWRCAFWKRAFVAGKCEEPFDCRRAGRGWIVCSHQ
jgi:hypothetical protein